MDKSEAVSELERVAILLDSTAEAITIEDPRYAIAVEPMRRSAAELRTAIENLRALWADE